MEYLTKITNLLLKNTITSLEEFENKRPNNIEERVQEFWKSKFERITIENVNDLLEFTKDFIDSDETKKTINALLDSEKRRYQMYFSTSDSETLEEIKNEIDNTLETYLIIRLTESTYKRFAY